MKRDVNVESGFALEVRDESLYPTPNSHKGLVDGLFYRSISAFTEDYISGLTGLHLHLGIGPGRKEDEQRQWCAIFRRVQACSGYANFSNVLAGETELTGSEPAHNCRNDAMLARVIQVLKDREGISRWIVLPSLKRLLPLNECPVFLAEPANSPSPNRIEPISPILPDEDREGISTVLESHDIERRPGVMNKVADHERPVIEWGLFSDSQKQLANPCVLLAAPLWLCELKIIRVRIDEPFNALAQSIEMLLCALELELPVRDWSVSHGVYRSGEESTEAKDPEGRRDTRPQAPRLLFRPQEDHLHPHLV